MKFMKNRLFAQVAIAVAATVSVANGWAADARPAYPDKPVKIVVPFAPGAGTDAMGRLMAQKLGEVMGLPSVAGLHSHCEQILI